MIDTHVHFWQYNEQRDTWMDEGIQRNFLPQNIDPIVKENAVDGLIAVQADQSETETNFLIDLAKSYAKIVGIIGWIDLLSTDLKKHISPYKEKNIVKGWRHIVQAEPKGFLNNPLFIQNVKTLGSYDYIYEILIFHHQLPEVLPFISVLHPTQTLVLNHLAKPNLKTGHNSQWRQYITELATHQNIYCKLSGLVTEAESGKWTKDMIYPYLDIALEAFGTDRVMFGSDWPVMTLNSNYTEWTKLIKEYLQQFTQKEQHQILHQNAVKCYKLHDI